MEKVRIQDDLYWAVNGEWQETAVIPDDKHTVGGFSDLDTGVEKLMMADFEEFASGAKKPGIKEVEEAVKLYKKVLDYDRRNAEGIKPVLPVLERIKNLKSVADLNKHIAEFVFADVDLPVTVGVTEDMADATRHAFIILGPSLILPDTTYYAEDNTQGKALIGLYSQMVSALLKYTPLSEAEQAMFLEKALSFDSKVSKCVKSQLEWADYVKNHNPMPLEEVQKLIAPLDLESALKEIYGEKYPEIVVVYDPRAIQEFNHYFSEENFDEYVCWAYIKELVSATNCLSSELKQIGGTYRRALTGIAVDPEPHKEAYQMVSRIFSEPIGVYYGRNYFGEEAKADITALVYKIIDTYKLRMKKNSFLKEETKEKAIKKLSTIKVKMGYPDKIDPFYSSLVIDDNDSYFETMHKLMVQRIKREAMKLNKPVDRSEWLMPGHMVNACYNPSANDITFPAAILQKPFYSLSQSVSENLGGIGAVIGHEISHAFDNNGAHFDENGNLANWWSEEDFAAFKALTKGMIEQFDGIEFHGGRVNGELVVSENIADNGGMGVTLEIMHTLPNPDFQGYFKNWARVWCRKSREEIIQYLLVNDVHSPAELRANMAPRNFQEWYDAFDVKETDKMFVPKDKRISIW